jgi:hypothetical protein
LLVAGCGDAKSSAPTTSTSSSSRAKPTRKQDVAWVVLLRKWENRLGIRSSRATRVASDVRSGAREQPALDRAVRPLEHCAETLEEDVGEPVVPRYRQGYGLFKTACAAVSTWAKTLRESGDDASLAKQAAGQEQKINESFGDAETHLVSSFLAVKDLPIQGGDHSRSRIEPRFGRALNRLLYKSASAAQVEVRCWSKEDWPKVKYEYGGYAGNIDFAGFAYDDFRISIASEYCASLVQLVYKHARPTRGKALLYAAASVELLAHEGGHLYFSETNEAKTECYAVQRARELGRILGLGGTYSDDLAAVYWKYVYPHNTREYRTPACRNGGPLDLNPKSDLWP